MMASAFSADDFFKLLCDMFPDGRRAAVTDIAPLIQRVRQGLDAAQMPAAHQRRYMEEALVSLAVLMVHTDRAVFDAAGLTPPTEAEVQEVIQDWLAVFWPVDSLNTDTAS